MRLVIQRVSEASVSVDKTVISNIDHGLLVFLGIHEKDDYDQIDFLVDKLINLRIFEDNQNKMNLSVKDIQGQILLISQFTLYANCMKGRRPSFTDAKKSEIAIEIYNTFFKKLKNAFSNTSQGKFQADMKISLVNDGPVTVILEK